MTWIHVILEYPLKTIRPAWAELSSRWMKRYFPHVHGDKEYKIEGKEEEIRLMGRVREAIERNYIDQGEQAAVPSGPAERDDEG